MEKNFIKISEYAERMSLHIRTVYRYFHSGKIEGFQDEETKTIFIKNPFSEKNLFENSNEKRAVLYARVSSSENRANLETQMERLKNYANAKGYKIISEVKEVEKISAKSLNWKLFRSSLLTIPDMKTVPNKTPEAPPIVSKRQVPTARKTPSQESTFKSSNIF